MNFLEELKKIKYKELSPEENIEFNSDVGKIESSIKTEIKKSNLILQKKFDNLEKEINNLNLENDTLKKELFKSEREKKDLKESLFEILDIYFPLNNLVKDTEIKITIDLMKKKALNILRKMKIEETTNIGDPFNSFNLNLSSNSSSIKIFISATIPLNNLSSILYFYSSKVLNILVIAVNTISLFDFFCFKIFNSFSKILLIIVSSKYNSSSVLNVSPTP